jgi:hypothetical protein
MLPKACDWRGGAGGCKDVCCGALRTKKLLQNPPHNDDGNDGPLGQTNRAKILREFAEGAGGDRISVEVGGCGCRFEEVEGEKREHWFAEQCRG